MSNYSVERCIEALNRPDAIKKCGFGKVQRMDYAISKETLILDFKYASLAEILESGTKQSNSSMKSLIQKLQLAAFNGMVTGLCRRAGDFIRLEAKWLEPYIQIFSRAFSQADNSVKMEFMSKMEVVIAYALSELSITLYDRCQHIGFF